MAASRYVIHLLGRELPLPCGEITIGRSPDCELVLGGPSVSRRHATLRAEGDRVLVVNASANGIAVNGEFVQGKKPLQPGDRVRIGDHELVLARATSTLRRGPEGSGAAAEPVDDDLSDTLVGLHPSMLHGSRDSRGGTEQGLAETRSALQTAEDALDTADLDRASTVLARAMPDVPAAALTDASLPERAGVAAARLAASTGDGRWIDRIVGIYAMLEWPMAVAVIDALHTALSTARGWDVGAFRGYVLSLQARLSELDERARFLVRETAALDGGRLSQPD